MIVRIQRQEILGYAKRNGVQIVRFFADHDCIADIALRQGLSDALAFIASGKAQALAVASLCRLSSSPEDIVRFVEQHRLLEAGAVLIAVKEGLDTRTAEGRHALGVLGGVTGSRNEQTTHNSTIGIAPRIRYISKIPSVHVQFFPYM